MNITEGKLTLKLFKVKKKKQISFGSTNEKHALREKNLLENTVPEPEKYPHKKC